MPTPGGKPRPGERIRFSRSLPPDWKRDWVYGTVLYRSPGEDWAIKVRWDEPRRADSWLNPGPYFMKKGDLEVVL